MGMMLVMDIYRKIGVFIVMIIPTFVSSGLVWDLFHCWFCVFADIAVMIVLTCLIVSGKFLYDNSTCWNR